MRIASMVKCFAIAFASASVWAGVQATKPAPGPAATTPKTAPASTTATQFYLEYRAVYDTSQKFDDILPYWSASKRKQAEDMPAIVRGQGFGIMKSTNPVTGVTVIKEEATADGGATLTVEGVRPDKTKRTGVVTLVKESSAWKVAGERWS